ncbi:hypothetical protein M3Y96_00521700 [Aphelenchoides besseyi]|nr:hypothetical protein M3Y96_00521700 [Aphelenchoides besseyi]
MFRRLTFTILLIDFVAVEAYGNHECIKEKNFGSPGYFFENCTGLAELAVKWNTKYRLLLSIWALEWDMRNFVLVVNDQCKLDFEGKDGEQSYGKWTNKKKKVIECLSIYSCQLYISAYGNLKIWHDSPEQDLGCDNMLNLLNSTWAWTKFRVEKLPASYNIDISIYNSTSHEDILEHVLPETLEPSALERETAEFSDFFILYHNVL